MPQLRRVILSLRTHEQRKLIQNIVVICTHRYLRDEVGIGDRKSLLETPPTVGGVIALLLQIAAVEERVLQHLEDFVTDFQSSSGVLSPMTRRAIVATLVNQDGMLGLLLSAFTEC